MSNVDALIEAAIEALDGIGPGDPEAAHSEADGILLSIVPRPVSAAWERAAERVGFWYA